jgi:PH (Pleckstrin Homology) domain-containing protein
MPPIPNVPRLASPGYARSVGADVLALGLAGFVGAFIVPRFGGEVLLVCFALALATAYRRRTVGIYDTDDTLVIRNFLRTRAVPWREARTVKVERDLTMPWLHVAALVRNDGGTVPVTGLRHSGEPNEAVMAFTRLVRERREGLSREVWREP